ncbi:MAG: DUF4367 domain-containing protein [Eubacteriales bacterium]|nr:DUF4367 domain-containing protein [Eubacteriales bacterium]
MEEKKRDNKTHQNDENFKSDDNIGRMLRWSLEESCGHIEREANQNPETKDIKPSDDLLERIIKELKDRGEWDKDPEDDQTDNYNMLSKEDREFLELGKKVKKINKRTIFLKRAAIVACVGICIFGVSMTSEANRQYMVGLWNEIVGNSQLRIKINVEDEKDSEIEVSLEEDAKEKIKEELGIQPIEMVYRPDGMEFSHLSLEKEEKKAVLFYEYKNTVFTISMQKKESKSKFIQEFDATVINEIEMRGIKDKIAIWKMDGIEETYATQLEGKETCYIMRGSIAQTEFEKIVKNLIISN